MQLDFSQITDDQLMDLIRACCREAANRGAETGQVAQSILLDEAERAKIARIAAERALAEAAKAEAVRVQAEAENAAKRAIELEAEKKAEQKIAENWKYKEEIGRQVSAILKPTRNCTLKVWKKAGSVDKRIYIGGGFDDNDVTYFHTGNCNEPPRKMTVSVSKDVGITKDDRDAVKAALLPILESICEKWNLIEIPIPEWKNMQSESEAA